MSALTRRAALCGIATLPALGGAAAALAATKAPSEFEAIFAEWHAMYAGPYKDNDLEYEVIGEICRAMNALARKLVAIPTTDPREIVLKIMAVTAFGDFGDLGVDFAGQIWDDMFAVAEGTQS